MELTPAAAVAASNPDTIHIRLVEVGVADIDMQWDLMPSKLLLLQHLPRLQLELTRHRLLLG